jgi:protein required for attachment to host cells
MPAEMDWALVADAQHARFLERHAPLGAWAERTDEAIEQHIPPSREQGTERPGRVQESVGTTHHAVEPRTDPHREAKRAFARHLAERLEAEVASYVRLTLVAPPAFLGDLRAELGEATRRKLGSTLDKDLTRASLADIVAHLDALP